MLAASGTAKGRILSNLGLLSREPRRGGRGPGPAVPDTDRAQGLLYSLLGAAGVCQAT